MSSRKTIVAVGEVLWDMFPEGPQFGGAPANFAGSVAEIADGSIDVYVVSAVGPDELGRRALEILRQRGVNIEFVSVVPQETGQVLVHVDSAGQASYEFAADTAWDNLPWSDELQSLAARADAVCFGTLGQRGLVSRETITKFLAATRADALRILDINLRPPFWSDGVVLSSLEKATVLKLNHDELKEIASVFNLVESEDQLIKQLMTRYSLKAVAVTRGPEGAFVRTATGDSADARADSVKVVNTVGAGDSYAAALTLGLLRGLPLGEINQWGNRLAAFVCTQPGATPRIPAELRQP